MSRRAVWLIIASWVFLWVGTPVDHRWIVGLILSAITTVHFLFRPTDKEER